MVQTIRNGVKDATASSLGVRQVSVKYPAYPVEHRDGSPSLAADLTLVKDLVLTGQSELIEQGLYMFSVDLGVKELKEVIDDSLARCQGREKIILSGYSAGALVIHKFLSENPNAAQLAGVALVADPARDTSGPEGQPIAAFGTPPVGPSGIYTLANSISSTVFPSAPLTPEIRQLTLEVCNTADPVCDVEGALAQGAGGIGDIGPITRLDDWLGELGTALTEIHTGYGKEGNAISEAALRNIGATVAGRLNHGLGESVVYSDTPLQQTLELNLNRTPLSIAVDGEGTRYIVDGQNIVWRLPAGSTDPGPWIQIPWLNSVPVTATSVAVDWTGNVFVHDVQNKRIVKISPQGRMNLAYASIPDDRGGPLATDWLGNVYLGDRGTGTVRKFSPGGSTFTTVAVTPGLIQGIAVAPSGTIYTSNDPNPPFSGQHEFFRLTKISPDGSVDPHFATLPINTSGGWAGSLAADSMENIYTSDAFLHRVAKVTPSGRVVADYATVGANRQGGPVAVAVDRNDVLMTVNLGTPLDSITELTPVPQTAPLQFSAAPAPQLSGEAVEGKVLTADAGNWSPAPANFVYEWFRDDALIVDATGSTLTLTGADVGSRISVSVTASRDGYANTTTTSATSGPVAGAVVVPPQDTPVTPAAPTFDDATGEYVIPGVPGVEYWQGGQLKAAGVHHSGWTRVEIEARPQSGFTISGTSHWSHDFVQPQTPPPAESFTDIGLSGFQDEITWMKTKGISRGYEDGTYRPFESVSREAMAAFVYRLAGEPDYTAPAESPFGDVSTGHGFYKEIAWMKATGLSTGWSDGTYRPYDLVSREAMAAFMKRYAGAFCHVPGADSFVAPATPTFVDSRTSGFYKEIEWMRVAEVSTGWADGTYRPFENVTREAMAAFMQRLDTHITGKGGCTL